MINVPSPQNQEKAQLRAAPNTRVQGAKGPQISTGFADVLAQRLNQNSNAKLRERARNLKYIRDKANNEMDTLSIMAKEKVAILRGEEAQKQLPNIQQKLDQDFSSLISEKYNSQDPEVRNILDIVKGNQISSFQKTAIPHAYKQMNDVRLKASAQAVKNLTEKTIEFSSNPDEFDNGIKAVQLQAMEDAALNFGPDSKEAKRVGLAYAEKTVSETILGAINVQATNGAVEDAEKILEKYSGQLLEQDKIKAQRAMTKAHNQRGSTIALQLEQDGRSLYGDDEEAVFKYIENNVPEGIPNRGDVIRQAKAAASVNASMKRRANKKVEEEQFRSGIKTIDERIKNGQSVTISDLQGIENPSLKIRALNYARNAINGTLTTDDGVYNFLIDALEDESLKDMDLSQYKDKLAPSDYKKFQTRQMSLISAENNQERRVQNQSFDRYISIAKRFIKQKDEELFEMDEDMFLSESQKTKLIRVAEDMFDRLQDQNLPEKEIRRRLKKALNEQAVTIEESAWYNPFTSDEAKVADVLEIDDGEVDKSPMQIHPSWNDAIQARALGTKRKPLSPAQLQMALKRLRESGVDLTKRAGTR